MEKVLYATWRPDDQDTEAYAEKLRGQVVADLEAAGARGVQVNVFDADVADATLNRPLEGTQIDAVVGVWLDSARDEIRLPVEEVLRSVSKDVAGWVVTESVPMPGPTVPRGERTPGLSNMAFVCKLDSLSQAEFMNIWQNSHTQVAIDTQSTFGYVQNAVVRPVTDNAFEVSAIVEEVFPIEAQNDPHVFFDSRGDEAELQRRRDEMAASTGRFLEPGRVGVLPTSRYVMSTPFA